MVCHELVDGPLLEDWLFNLSRCCLCYTNSLVKTGLSMKETRNLTVDLSNVAKLQET